MRRIQLLGVIVVAACGKSAPGPVPALPIAADTAFVDVTVVAMDGEHELPHQTVLVKGDRIIAIGPARSTTAAAGAVAIDGTGKWLVPGLVDMHVHFNDERDGLLYIANGVTTVRNMWGDPRTLEWRAHAKRDPTYPGPSIYTAGPILDGKPPIWPTSTVIETPEQAEAEVAAEKAAGYDFIKVYDNLRLDVYDALAAAAKRHGIPFAGHDPRAVPLAHALASGQASIEHLTGYLLAVQDDRSKAATMTWPAQGAELVAHIDDARIPVIAKATRDAGVAVCPTLVVLSRFGALDHPDLLQARPENRYVLPAVLASWDPTQDFRTRTMTADSFALTRKTNEIRAKILKGLVDAGVQILAGTDTSNPYVVAGFSLHEELELLVGAGMTPYQALRAATAAPAAWLDAITELGTIAVGTRADLVLLDADPLMSISATQHRTGVMVRGTWYTQAALQARLDALVASYAPRDRLAGVPPLPVGPADGDPVGTATFVVSFAGAELSSERLAVSRTKDGGMVIVAQAASDPPQPRLATLRIELDRAGAIARLTLDQDGARGVAIEREHAGFYHVVSSTKGRADQPSEAALGDAVFDTELVASMIVFADRALREKPGAKVRIAGKMIGLTPQFSLVDDAYQFERPARDSRVMSFTSTSPLGTSSGRYELDEHGVPVSITLETPAGTLSARRR